MECFIPTLVYGVEEDHWDKVLNNDFLKTYNVKRYFRILTKSLCSEQFVYGIEVTVEEALTISVCTEKVDEFVTKLKEDYDIDLGEPDLYLCIDGPSKLAPCEYTPDKCTAV